MSQLLESLTWRYATKKFDPTKKITDEKLTELLEAMRLTATSYGLQPYKFLVIENPDLRAKIRTHAWDQPQVTDASHLIAICNYRTMDEAYVDHYIDSIVKERGVTREMLAGYRQMMVGSLKARTPENATAWMKNQAYIVLGFLLSAAAEMKIDSCPMEGFEATKVDDVLDLAEKNLTVATLCPVGYRSADDTTAAYAKVRFPFSEIVETIS